MRYERAGGPQRATHLRLAILTAMVLIATGALFLPTPDFVMAKFAPVLPLSFVFFYSAYRPGEMPYWVAFLTGMVTDLWAGMPLGLNALIFFALALFWEAQQRFLLEAPFLLIWALFTLSVLFWAVVQWLVLSLFHAALLAPGELVLQVAVAVALMPLLMRLFALVVFWERSE